MFFDVATVPGSAFLNCFGVLLLLLSCIPLIISFIKARPVYLIGFSLHWCTVDKKEWKEGGLKVWKEEDRET